MVHGTGSAEQHITFPCNVVSEDDQGQFNEFLIVIAVLSADRVMDAESDEVLS